MFPVTEGHWPPALKCPVSTWPPWGLTKSKFLQPRSTPGLGQQVLLCDLQRCFIFHCIPLLLKSCTSASPKFILRLTRRPYFSQWPHTPWQQAPFWLVIIFLFIRQTKSTFPSPFFFRSWRWGSVVAVLVVWDITQHWHSQYSTSATQAYPV